MKNPIRIGIIGMGGFAGWHHGTVAKLEERGHARLMATCDPQPSAFAEAQEKWHLAERGVRVFADYRAMLEACHGNLDLVVVPTPIQLRRRSGCPSIWKNPPPSITSSWNA